MRHLNAAFHEKFPIHHEIYSRYFMITASLLRQAQERGELTLADIYTAAREMGYELTMLSLPGLLTCENGDDGDGASNSHPLFRECDGGNFMTPVKPVTRPLSLLERRWLAAVLRDSRIGLFLDEDEIKKVLSLLRDSRGADAEPLFDDESYCRFDSGRDSDNYRDEDFRSVFRTILKALRGGNVVEIEYTGYSGRHVCKQIMPMKIEYAMKYDLFRLIYKEMKDGRELIMPIRIKRIERASEISNRATPDESPDMKKVRLSVSDENSALERAHIRFANYRVSVENVEQDKRILCISYPHYEEDTLIEAVLSFGPAAQVLAPEHVVDKIRAKLSRQAGMMNCFMLK